MKVYDHNAKAKQWHTLLSSSSNSVHTATFNKMACCCDCGWCPFSGDCHIHYIYDFLLQEG